MANIFKNDGRDAWAALHNGILAGLKGEKELTGVVVQPLQVAERADWDTQNRFLNLYREQRIANLMPTWNAVYVPNTGVNVPDEYQAFMDQLNSEVIKDAGVADPKKLERLDLERKTVQDKLQKSEYHVNQQWDRYVANNRGKPPLSRSQWETDYGYSATRFTYQTEVSAAIAAYMREVNTAGGDLLEVGRALSAFSDPRQRLPLPQDDDDASLPPDSWQYWYRAGLTDDINNFLNTKNVWDIELNEHSVRTSKFEDRWSGGANVSFFGLFGVSGSVSNETIRTHSETDTSSIKIHFENIQSFAIDRGQWFKAGLISRFRDRMPDGFWGQGGRLNLIPASITLVRGVKIEVNTSSTVTDYYFNKRTTGGNAGFSFGPWRVGGGGSRTTIEENYNMQRTASGFTIEDMSSRAQIIAVSSIRNADLLVKPTDAMPLYKLLNDAEIHEGRLLMEEARYDAQNLRALLGVKSSS